MFWVLSEQTETILLEDYVWVELTGLHDHKKTAKPIRQIDKINIIGVIHRNTNNHNIKFIVSEKKQD